MVVLVLITILFPPLGVWMVAGCGMDLFINICLTCLGLLPGHLHAFYLIWVYYDRREQGREGRYAARPAPGVYSSHVQTGGGHAGHSNYGTVNHPPPPRHV